MKLSIRYKLLLMMGCLSAITLVSYGILATQLFEKDKIAYLYDSSAAVAHSVGIQTGTKLDLIGFQLKTLFSTLNLNNKILPEDKVVQDLFEIQSISIYEKGPNGSLRKKNSLKREGVDLLKSAPLEIGLVEEVAKDGYSLKVLDKESELILVGSREVTGNIIVSTLRLENFLKNFQKNRTYQNFLVTKEGKIIVGPENFNGADADFSSWTFFGPMVAGKLPEGAKETESPSKNKVLVSYSQIKNGNFYVISIVDKNQALKAIDVLIKKSALFFIALLALGVMLSVFASNYVTSTLLQLYEATKQIGQGNFDFRVDIRSKDEVGSLATSFNQMSDEVGRLLKETAEKARMEKELQIAHTVQETLFPESFFKADNFELAGFYVPASECSGDWWHYCEIAGQIYLWIGDATGHGVPAALLTSAARSAVAVMELLDDLTPSRAMEILNQAIFKTSKGKMQMTFFLAAFNKETMELRYCNASHEAPILMQKGGDGKLETTFLNKNNNPRLGERESDVDYSETAIKCLPGAVIILYTDGVLDIRDADDRPFGEKRFIKTLEQVVSDDPRAKSIGEKLMGKFKDYGSKTQLRDDVTFMVCKIN